MKRGALLLAPAVAAPAPAFAVQEGGLLSPSAGLMFWTVVTFLVVLGLLWKFAYPHILGAVEAREKALRALLEEAERDRTEAAALLEKQQQQLEENRARAHEILAQSKASSEKAREEMLAETRREQETLLERARREIGREREQAVEQLRRETVELALAAAGKLVGDRLDADGHRELVRDYLRAEQPAGKGG